MMPTNRIPIHPGEMLVEEFLGPIGISQSKFAEHLKIPIQRVNEIANARRGVTPATAILFGAALGTTPEFWMTLQASHDLALARSRIDRVPGMLRAASVGPTADRDGASAETPRSRRFAVSRSLAVKRK